SNNSKEMTMIGLNTALKIRDMINKECCRESLVDLCEYWEVTTDDYYEFIDAALDAIKQEEENGQ
ncbi:MAG: hypothetical protein IJS15_14570, partial [Victivallales bacterium]|nr:hypothetical protein [Victivallales bacterium]